MPGSNTPTKSDALVTASVTGTITAENSRLRQGRRERWRIASYTTHYWKARLRFWDAVEIAQNIDLPEGRQHPLHDRDDRWAVPDNYRQAIVRQLLTPAADVNSVNWKKATFAAGQHKYTDVKPERIERAIADDIAFLTAHPTRRSINATKKPERA